LHLKKKTILETIAKINATKLNHAVYVFTLTKMINTKLQI